MEEEEDATEEADGGLTGVIFLRRRRKSVNN